jgi:hypothetical protein
MITQTIQQDRNAASVSAPVEKWKPKARPISSTPLSSAQEYSVAILKQKRAPRKKQKIEPLIEPLMVQPLERGGGSQPLAAFGLGAATDAEQQAGAAAAAAGKINELMYVAAYKADSMPPTEPLETGGPSNTHNQGFLPHVNRELPEDAPPMYTLHGRQPPLDINVAHTAWRGHLHPLAMMDPGQTHFNPEAGIPLHHPISASSALKWLCTGSAADDLLPLTLFACAPAGRRFS